METNKEQIQLFQLPYSKADIQDFFNKILDLLDAGTHKPSDILLRFKAFDKVFDAVKPHLTELVVNEISLYPKAEANILGAEFKVAEAGVSYDYTRCGDVKWESLNQQLESIKVDIKKREEFLKGIKGHETIVDEISGEILTIYPPIRKSSTSIKVTIK